MTKLYILFLVLSLSTGTNVFGQVVTKSNNNSTSGAICPNQNTTYEVSRPSGFTGCQITWSATNGTVESQNGATATIKWSDTPGATGTVTATFSNCGNSNDGKTASKAELILSVKNQAWGWYDNSENLDYCTNAQVYLTVPHMYVSGTGGIGQPLHFYNELQGI